MRFRAGVGFGNTGQMLRGEASIGYGRQTPLDSRLPPIDGIVIAANMAWRATALTALLLRASADVVETSTPLSSGGLTQRYQAELRHAFLRLLIGTASASYATTAFQGIGLTENQTDLGLGLEYYLGPEAILYGRYQHSIFRTNAAAAEWDADEVRIGADLVIFDENTVSDKATFDQPHQYAVGFSNVIVNGEVVFDGEKMTGIMPGQPLYGLGKAN
mgnify:CR=1 FL=1